MKNETFSQEENKSKALKIYGLYILIVILFLISIFLIPSKLSTFDLVLFLPRLSRITDLKQNSSIEVSPEGSIFYVAVVMVVLYMAWYETINKRAEIMTTNITELEENVKEQVNDGNTDLLLKNCVNMMDQVDFEYKCLQAACAYNNETPGVKYGGEVEWALGETSSEDELIELSEAVTRSIEAVTQS